MDTQNVGKQKTPERTCVACGAKEGKKQLVRFVRSKDGKVACDAGGKSPGRGAYVCADEKCFEAAEKRDRLSRALKCRVSNEDYHELKQSFRDVCALRKQ